MLVWDGANKSLNPSSLGRPSGLPRPEHVWLGRIVEVLQLGSGHVALQKDVGGRLYSNRFKFVIFFKILKIDSDYSSRRESNPRLPKSRRSIEFVFVDLSIFAVYEPSSDLLLTGGGETLAPAQLRRRQERNSTSSHCTLLAASASCMCHSHLAALNQQLLLKHSTPQ